MDDEWNDLRVFLMMVRAKTLAAAGAQLEIDPSTVFRRIGRLEARLATRLFERRGRGWVLTSAGEELAAHSERVEAAVHDAHRAVVGHDDAVRGTIRFTTNESLLHHLLAPHLVAFQRAHPEVILDVAVQLRIFALGRGEADVALRPGARPTEDDVVARPLVTGGGAFYAATSYLERVGRPRERSELSRLDAVGLDESLAHVVYASVIERTFEPSRVRVRCSSLSAQAAMVEAGAGVAPLPCYLMDHRAGVERLFPPEEDLAMKLWVVFHRDMRTTGRVRAFVEFITARIESERARLEG